MIIEVLKNGNVDSGCLKSGISWISIDFTLRLGTDFYPAVLRFASVRIEDEWNGGEIHPMLRVVINEAANFAFTAFDEDLTLTCLLRTVEEDRALYGFDLAHQSGVHVYGRGADIRTYDMPLRTAYHIMDYLNATFLYDTHRPKLHCVGFEGATVPGSTGNHLHCKVHDRTVKVNKGEVTA
jgi:hypothetical protein